MWCMVHSWPLVETSGNKMIDVLCDCPREPMTFAPDKIRGLLMFGVMPSYFWQPWLSQSVCSNFRQQIKHESKSHPSSCNPPFQWRESRPLCITSTIFAEHPHLTNQPDKTVLFHKFLTFLGKGLGSVMLLLFFDIIPDPLNV